jgi:hypothetical protein
MVFSISAFALFILISYYASNNSLQAPMQTKGIKAHQPWMDLNRMQAELKSANLGKH